MIITILALLAASPTVPFTVVGEGNTSCGQWTDLRRENPNRVLPESAWVLGYITAVSRDFAVKRRINITHGLTGAAVDHWIDIYCASHPLDDIMSASNQLVVELARRAR